MASSPRGKMRRTTGRDNIDCEFYNKDSHSRRIVFFSTDIDYENNEDAFVFMAQMAKRMGHDVVIVTTNCARKTVESHLRSMKVYQIGQLIPKFIFGTLYLPLYFLRTIYSTLWLLKMKNSLNPSFVVVPNANAVVPFLKLVGKLHIVQIHRFTEKELIAGSLDEVNIRRKKFHQFYVRHADEIVVQNKLSRNVFKKVFTGTDKLPAVLYPCVDTSAFESCTLVKVTDIIRIPDDAIIFVSFGSLRRTSNFELLIDAFQILLNQLRSSSPCAHINLYLIIASHYEGGEEYNEYASELQNSALRFIQPCVLFLNALSVSYRKSLMNRCEAVLYPMVKSLDGRIILEAGLMSKPVLAANSGIALELVKEGVNGFLIYPEPEQFAKCMHALVYNKHLADNKERSKKIYNYFKKNYSKLRYSCELQNLIIRNSRHVIDSESHATSTIFRV